MAATEMSHEPDAHRYVLRADGAIASVLEEMGIESGA